MCLHVFQIEDIRNSIDKIDENVTEVKKLYSVVLSAPTSDQSKTPGTYKRHTFPLTLPSQDYLRVFLSSFYFSNWVTSEFCKTERKITATQCVFFLNQSASYCYPSYVCSVMKRSDNQLSEVTVNWTTNKYFLSIIWLDLRALSVYFVLHGIHVYQRTSLSSQKHRMTWRRSPMT